MSGRSVGSVGRVAFSLGKLAFGSWHDVVQAFW